MSSYNGQFYSPYYQPQQPQQQQQQQQSSNHASSSYAQQTSTSQSQYFGIQLPAIDQSRTPSTPVSRAYETSSYPSYNSYNRTDSRSDYRAGSRSEYAGYPPTSRADDGYGGSSYASVPARNDSPITDGTRRSQVAQGSRDAYGSTGGSYGTSYSRNDYTSQKSDDQSTTAPYQYPSTHTSTSTAHATPYTQAPQPQSTRQQSSYNANYGTSQTSAAQQSEEASRHYQLPSISKDVVSQENRRTDSGQYNQRSNQSPRLSKLPSYTSQTTPQQVPQSIPTPEPRTSTPQQIYREDRSNPRQVAVSQNENVSASTDSGKTKESQVQTKKPRPQQPRSAKPKGSIATKQTRVSNATNSSHELLNSAVSSERSSTTYASQSAVTIEDEPVTVDPSRVFNQEEYRRRKDAIEAESRAAKEVAEKAKDDARKAKEEAARKTADEAKARAAAKEKEKQEALKKEREVGEAQKRRIMEDERKKRVGADEEARRQALANSSNSKSTSAPQSRAQVPAQTVEGSTGAALASPTMAKDSPNADAIKSLFGSMFNQMRELKAKDPTLFSEVWEDFKKVIILNSPDNMTILTPRIDAAAYRR